MTQVEERGAEVLGRLLASLELQMGGVVSEIESLGLFVLLPDTFAEMELETQEIELAHALRVPLVDLVSPRVLATWAEKAPDDQDLWEEAKATLLP